MSVKRGYDQIAADVVLAQKGDAEAMNRILADVQDTIYYNCKTMLQNEQAAQDATQDILITIYQKIGAVSDPKAYVAWVQRITANHCKNRLCKVNKEFLMPASEDDEDPFAAFEDTDEQRIPDKAFDNEETRRMIVDLVNGLPDEQRMCVMLYYYDEMKTREIAETLKVSEGTIKSRLNYARKSIKEGVKAYEKQGIKLYSMSPIPFLGYFLGKTAAGISAPIVAADIAAAATAAAATATAATATATAATATTAAATTGAASGIGAFFTTVMGKVVAGIAVVAVLGGVGTGVALAVRQPETAAVMAKATEQPTFLSTEAPTPEPTRVPTATPTEVPTPTPTLEPTPEPTPEPPEMTFQRLTGLDEEETDYLLDGLKVVLAGQNDLGFATNSPIVEIWEIHSLAAYCTYRETDAWKEDVPESELACYGVRLADGTVFYLYLGDGLPKDGVTAHEWEIYRVRIPDGEDLYAQTYLSGPQWTEWSTETPPENAVEIKTQIQYRGRCYIEDYLAGEGEDGGFRTEENAIETCNVIIAHPAPYAYATAKHYRAQNSLGEYEYHVHAIWYSDWTGWTDKKLADQDICDSVAPEGDADGTQTQTRTRYRYRRR